MAHHTDDDIRNMKKVTAEVAADYLGMRQRSGASRKDKVYDISALCRLFGVTPNTIRYYEKVELLHPAYSEGGHRKYSNRDVAELLHMKTMHALGLELSEISQHFHRVPRASQSETRTLPRNKIEDCDRQIALLEERKFILERYIACAENTDHPLQAPQEMTFPAVRLLSLGSFSGRSVKQQQLLSKWISAIPAVRIMDEYLVEDGHVVSPKTVLCMREAIFEKLQLEPAEAITAEPEMPAMRTYICKPYEAPRTLDQADIEEVITLMQDRYGSRSMRIISRCLFAFMQQDQPMNYIEVWASKTE